MSISAIEKLSKCDADRLLGNSSGLMLEKNNGELSIGFVDYAVEQLGGRDFECFYKLDKANSEKIVSALAAQYSGELFDMCVEAFTIKFSVSLFEKFCLDNGISYVKATY